LLQKLIILLNESDFGLLCAWLSH